ncbi:hypothetical protein [Duganella sp. Leaf61]|uniref:hypothetical protein n=1 Tax=Duganella sp. Leaf61 TaxID=1736227 RepID=UPI000A4CCFF4|nr:hypothetical protein [Duganella sp. Leaf61]
MLESASRISGDAGAIDALRLQREVRRHRHADGSVTVLARLSAEEDEQLRARTGLKVDTLNLEDLFVEVTR